MCGIFGAIKAPGATINSGIIRALAIANRERGTDSLGFFGSDGKISKSVGDPMDVLIDKDVNAYVENACDKGWFVAGHTRYATTGKVNTPNSHPFQFGRIIGAHNGMVQYPHDRKYTVDSQYLFDELNRANGDYQTALAAIDGYWGLSWFDGEAFYLQAHDNTVAVAQAYNGAWYYSSDSAHLAACLGYAQSCRLLEKGQTIRFCATSAELQEMPIFKSSVVKLLKAPARWNPAATAKQGGAKKHKGGKKRRKAGAPVELDYRGRLAYADYDYFDTLAIEAGYSSADEFMAVEGFRDETTGLRFLEDACRHSGIEIKDEDPYAAWADYSAEDGFCDGGDSAEIAVGVPF